jgi:hypothetical protein
MVLCGVVCSDFVLILLCCIDVDFEAILEKKFVQFSISSRAKQVKVTHWLTGEFHYVDVYADTSFNEFVNAIVDKLSLNSVVIYILPPPDHLWRKRVRLEDNTFREVVSCIIGGPIVDRPLLYAHPGDDSPESSLSHVKKANDDVSSISSAVTDRSGQDDFKNRTRFRDDYRCVFCGFSGQPLYAAHILEYALFKEDQTKFREYEMTGINDTCNGLTLCWNCHQAFDNNLVCVSPISQKLIVAEALQHCEPGKWQTLHDAEVVRGINRAQWPNDKLLNYRLGVMAEKAIERQEDRDEYPYRCEHCLSGCKTLKGLMNRHAGSQKCVKLTGKMSSYTTPRKTVIDDEECIFE